MNRVLISVEGQTEETFVRQILSPHLCNYQVYPTPVIVSTKNLYHGGKHKGGLVSYGKASNEILNLLKDTSAVAVTTMYDLYGLPSDFPGYQNKPHGSCYEKAAYLEAEFQRNINQPRFKPYLQVYEFEALLFVNPKVTASMFPGTDKASHLEAIRKRYASPEEINDGPTTAPSKRILSLYPSYQKPSDGARIVNQIGLENIRSTCPHFNQWLTWLEGLGK